MTDTSSGPDQAVSHASRPVAPAVSGLALTSETQAGDAGTGQPPVRPAYPPPRRMPTQAGPQGIRFDFNLGARVVLPTRTTAAWRVRLRDLDTGNILFESENQGAFVNCAKRWFVRFRVEVWDLEHGAAPPAGRCTHTTTRAAATCWSSSPSARWATCWPGSPTPPGSPRRTAAASPAPCRP